MSGKVNLWLILRFFGFLLIAINCFQVRSMPITLYGQTIDDARDDGFGLGGSVS